MTAHRNIARSGADGRMSATIDGWAYTWQGGVYIECRPTSLASPVDVINVWNYEKNKAAISTLRQFTKACERHARENNAAFWASQYPQFRGL